MVRGIHAHRQQEGGTGCAVEQVRLPTRAVQHLLGIRARAERDFNATVQRQERDAISAREAAHARVIDHCALRAKVRLDRFIPLVGFTDRADGANRHLRGQTELLADGIVDEPLQGNLVGAARSERGTCDGVAGGVERLHRPDKSGMLRVRWGQFDKHSLFHRTCVLHLMTHVNSPRCSAGGRRRIPPHGVNPGAFLRRFL
jgi:hypothetical protein